MNFDRSVGDRLRQLTDNDRHLSSPSVSFNQYLSTDVDPSTVGSLSLGACDITDLPVDLLAETSRLERLSLWSNNISRLPAGLFDATRQLRDLVVWNNRLDRLDPSDLAPLGGQLRPSPLRLIDVDRNRISSIASAWRRFPELEVLRASDNRIGSLVDGTFDGLRSLRALTLDRNRLAFVQSRAFGVEMPRLVRLSMADNELVFVPDGLFAGLRSLVELSLARNRIEHIWSRTFTGLGQLRRLDLSGNRLSQV